ncbi:MAG: hypothetical protein ACOC0T_00380, partial [Desulfovermiculus sp.]
MSCMGYSTFAVVYQWPVILQDLVPRLIGRHCKKSHSVHYFFKPLDEFHGIYKHLLDGQKQSGDQDIDDG